MLINTGRVAGMLAFAVLAIQFAVPAHATPTSECHDKFKAAEAAKTLNGMKWTEFKKTQCAITAATQKSVTDTQPKTKAPAPSSSTAVFPSSVSSKYAGQSAGRARMHTCLDQYDANKGSNANGGLRWIEKGGGYYSECNKRLKG